jgi:predicted ester cyclase
VIRGPAGLQAHYAGDHTGWPDAHMAIDDRIAEGDRVMTRWTWTGAHTGPYFGGPPANWYSTCLGVIISRIVAGKVAEEWWVWDSLAWLKQLGLADMVR